VGLLAEYFGVVSAETTVQGGVRGSVTPNPDVDFVAGSSTMRPTSG
jgi:hypothetical protein